MASKTSDFFSTGSFKLILLTGMVLQNSATVLVGRYTRSSVPTDELYVVNNLIIVTEIGKLLLSLVFEYFSTNGKVVESVKANIIDRPNDALKIMIPALLYLVQNSLLYTALSNLTAPVFQVTYQGKLVTTAIVSVIMLNRKYTFQQWVCLVVLSIGVAIVVLGEQSGGKKDDGKAEGAAASNLFVGLVAVTIACLSSALAGVYFEKVVKTASSGEKQMPVSVWMRNIQLALFTICLAPVGGWLAAKKMSDDDSSKPFFHGFTSLVWVLVGLQAGGGLLVAAVIKYADNVLKGLATGVSVCFATAVSTALFGTPLSSQFSIGAAMILVSVYFFSNPMKKEKASTPMIVSSPASSTGSLQEEQMKPILPK
jgi:solute carrier family 35 (UDP-sugar transporter), member A1/2/3